jgi:Tol biopolymer transport system component
MKFVIACIFFLLPTSFTAGILLEAHTAPLMKIFIGLDQEHPDLSEMAEKMNYLLSYTGQIKPIIRVCSRPTEKAALKALFDEGFIYGLFIMYENPYQTSWRLYDLVDQKMIKGTSFLTQKDLADPALYIANQVWYLLMGKQGPFLSRLCYVVSEKERGKKNYSIIVTDFDGGRPTTLFSCGHGCIAPQWNRSALSPAIIYSEFTSRNVRLVLHQLDGRKRVVLDVDGTAVGVSYDPSGNGVAYCRSGDIWLFQYNIQTFTATHRLLIHEEEPCASPSFTREGSIIYCMNGKIYMFDIQTGIQRLLTPQGYCVAPHYCLQTKKLYYSRKVEGVMQIFQYDVGSDSHQQLTFDKGDKIDPVCTACGSILTYVVQLRNKTYLENYILETGLRKKIWDNSGQEVGYPAWSSVECNHVIQ